MRHTRKLQTSKLHANPEAAGTRSGASILPRDWRIVRTLPSDGGWNMALDLALLDVARNSTDGILRLYGWSRPTISFGRNESIAGRLTPETFRQSGFDFVRRPTGGRALLHHREVTYSVTVPLSPDVRWHDAYAATNELLLQAMLRLGTPAALGRKPAVRNTSERAAPHATAPLPATEVCFSGIAEGELAIGPMKLVASSVWRDRSAYLQHGSILVFDDQRELVAALGESFEPPRAAAVLSEWVPGADSVESAASLVEHALQTSIEQCGTARWWPIPDDIVPAIEAKRQELMAPSWLWRR